MTSNGAQGFQRVARVQFTHGVPNHRWRGEPELVNIRIPAVAISGKRPRPLYAKVGATEFESAKGRPYFFLASGPADFWLYREAIFADFRRREPAEIQALADALLDR